MPYSGGGNDRTRRLVFRGSAVIYRAHCSIVLKPLVAQCVHEVRNKNDFKYYIKYS